MKKDITLNLTVEQITWTIAVMENFVEDADITDEFGNYTLYADDKMSTIGHRNIIETLDDALPKEEPISDMEERSLITVTQTISTLLEVLPLETVKEIIRSTYSDILSEYPIRAERMLKNLLDGSKYSTLHILESVY